MQKDKGKLKKEIYFHTFSQIGNRMSKNVQRGTEVAIKGMKIFKYKGDKLANVGYEQAKGNLFEYIEAAKLEKNMANAGKKPFDIFSVTDAKKEIGGIGEPHASDDLRFIKNGKVIGKGQAKVNNNPHNTAKNFVNSKYLGMQRNTTIDQLEAIKFELDKMLSKGEISQNVYNDTIENLVGMATDPETKITSGGTITKELKQFCGENGKVSKKAVRDYANNFEREQYFKEIKTTTQNVALISAAIGGFGSSVKNMFAVYKNQKNLKEALKDIGVDSGKSGVRGGIIGGISSVLRIFGTKKNVPIISDSNAAVVIAGSIVDSGVAIYEYSKGEIDAYQLKKELENTVLKSSATIYFTKAIQVATVATNTFIPIAVFSATSYMVACIREIIENARLNAEEYKRLTELNEEILKQVKLYHKELIKNMEFYKEKQRYILENFLIDFSNNLKLNKNYDEAIYSIINFATQTGIILQHTNFNDFKKAMAYEETFVLK